MSWGVGLVDILVIVRFFGLFLVDDEYGRGVRVGGCRFFLIGYFFLGIFYIVDIV